MENLQMIETFYHKGLTVNPETTPESVLGQLLADDFCSIGSVDTTDKAHLIQRIGFFWKLIPDLKWDPQEIIQHDDKVVVRSIASGSPQGDFMGLPTDGSRSFSIMTIDIHQVRDGQIVKVHHLEDWTTAIKQLKG